MTDEQDPAADGVPATSDAPDQAAADEQVDDELEAGPAREASIKVRGRPFVVRFGEPRSLAQVYDVLAVGTVHPFRGPAACLGLAWAAGASPKPPRATLAACRYDGLAYGGQVLDELLRRGADVGSIAEAGRDAYLFLSRLAIPGDEVEGARGN